MLQKSAVASLFPAGPAFAGGEETITRSDPEQTAEARSVTLRSRTFIDQGLVGAGRLPADTIDFLGDALGSFSLKGEHKKRDYILDKA